MRVQEVEIAPMLSVCTWKWGTKYTSDDVAKLAAGVRRNLKQPFRFLLITDDLATAPPGVEAWGIRDTELTNIPGCFARLRMFDSEWMAWHDIDWLVCLDLDLIVTGPLDDLFNRNVPFMILRGANTVNPCPYNGSMMAIRKDAHQNVWSDFSVDKAKAVPKHEFADDQGWIWHKVPGAAGWKAGENGVYAFQKPGWPDGDELPADARIVAFPGWRSPQKFKHLKWVQQHWRT